MNTATSVLVGHSKGGVFINKIIQRLSLSPSFGIVQRRFNSQNKK